MAELFEGVPLNYFNLPLQTLLLYGGKLWQGKNLANHVNIGGGEIKFGKSYHDMHPLCLISFTVLEQQLSSLDAVLLTSRLDS